MKLDNIVLCVLVSAASLLLGCKGDPGTPGVSGTLVQVQKIDSSSGECDGAEGVFILVGLDTNSDQSLDDDEIISTEGPICNGRSPSAEEVAGVLEQGVVQELQDQINQLRLDLQNTDCPAGYERDDDRMDNIVLCSKGPDEMVKVGDFWIDRYEASIWTEKECVGDPLTEDLEYDEFSFPDTGNWTAPLFACSVRGTTPSNGLTWFQAQQTCVLSGKRLCSNDEWQASVAGTVDPPGASDGQQGNPRCNTGLVDKRVSGRAGDSPGGEASCISHFGAEDMIGNLAEWTGSWLVGGHTTTPIPEDGFKTFEDPWPEIYNRDNTSHIFGNVSSPDGFVSGLPAALIRGGSVNEGNNSGAFRIHAGISPSGISANVGFRCCRR